MNTELKLQPLDCDTALEIVSASLDGEARLDEIDRLAVHLAGCATCRSKAQQLEDDDAWLRTGGLGSVEPVEVPPRRRGPVPLAAQQSPRRRWPWVAAAMAATLALVVLRAPETDRTVDPSVEGPATVATVTGTTGTAPIVTGTTDTVPTAERSSAPDSLALAAQLDQRAEEAAMLLAQVSETRLARRSDNPFRSHRSRNPFRGETAPSRKIQ